MYTTINGQQVYSRTKKLSDLSNVEFTVEYCKRLSVELIMKKFNREELDDIADHMGLSKDGDKLALAQRIKAAE